MPIASYLAFLNQLKPLSHVKRCYKLKAYKLKAERLRFWKIGLAVQLVYSMGEAAKAAGSAVSRWFT